MKGRASLQIIVSDIITPCYDCSAEVPLHQQLRPAAGQRAGGGPGDAAGRALGGVSESPDPVVTRSFHR